MLEKLNPRWLLFLGVLTIVATHVSFGIDAVAWFSSVPFLLYLDRTHGWRSRLWLGIALFVAWTLATAKIITDPIPFALVFLFSLPLTLIHLPAYLVWARFRHQKHACWLFPLVFTLMEWVQYTFLPFASWGVAANTQVHNLALLQSLSLFGMAGLSFVIHWANVSIVEAVRGHRWRPLLAPATVVAVLLVFGTLRLELGHRSSQETVLVAAVGTESGVSGPPFPDARTNAAYANGLRARTRAAARHGAKLVVWNEAAIFIQAADEAAWQDSLRALARMNQVALIAAYVVPDGNRLQNQFVAIDERGELGFGYHKHQPVPGEPSIKGDEPHRLLQAHGLGIGAAICYDMDYPGIARTIGQLGPNIVAIPSSDWRGIDPLHTEMAAFRAIEQGYSVLRSTRFGLSAGIDPYGNMVARQSSFDGHNKVMFAELPVRRVWTLYGLVGESFAYGCMLALLVVLWRLWRGQKTS